MFNYRGCVTGAAAGDGDAPSRFSDKWLKAKGFYTESVSPGLFCPELENSKVIMPEYRIRECPERMGKRTGGSPTQYRAGGVADALIHSVAVSLGEIQGSVLATLPCDTV